MKRVCILIVSYNAADLLLRTLDRIPPAVWQQVEEVVVLDDAINEIYYAQLVEQESTRTVLQALREVVEKKGLFCALYSDRASHTAGVRLAGVEVDRAAPSDPICEHPRS